MRMKAWGTAALAIMLLVSPVLAGTYTIPPDKMDGQRIYWGNAADFNKPGEVDYEAVIKATPEYAELVKKKIERGTAKFYYLMSQASDHAVRVIVEVGQMREYDLVAAKGYLASLETPIQADDLTTMVLERLKE
ncbi:MAG: hypothetical protein KA184_07345 [Candidatus Hydrogenedentes bacterium]|nr:hypothetical protein [Candidatus Hydrogenedentota bacterium]